MTPWTLALLGLAPPFALAVLAAFRGGMGTRFVAVQFATSIAVPILMLMTFAFDQSALIDVALTLSLMSLPGTLLLALFMERWL